MSISSDALTTIGIMRIASAMPAANPENPLCRASTQKAKMKRPATIEGRPTITPTKKRTQYTRRPRPYSERYTAARRPRGMANSAAIPTISPVPMMDWTIPPGSGDSGGFGTFVKNEADSADAPFATT